MRWFFLLAGLAMLSSPVDAQLHQVVAETYSVSGSADCGAQTPQYSFSDSEPVAGDIPAFDCPGWGSSYANSSATRIWLENGFRLTAAQAVEVSPGGPVEAQANIVFDFEVTETVLARFVVPDIGAYFNAGLTYANALLTDLSTSEETAITEGFFFPSTGDVFGNDLQLRLEPGRTYRLEVDAEADGEPSSFSVDLTVEFSLPPTSFEFASETYRATVFDPCNGNETTILRSTPARVQLPWWQCSGGFPDTSSSAGRSFRSSGFELVAEYDSQNPASASSASAEVEFTVPQATTGRFVTDDFLAETGTYEISLTDLDTAEVVLLATPPCGDPSCQLVDGVEEFVGLQPGRTYRLLLSIGTNGVRSLVSSQRVAVEFLQPHSVFRYSFSDLTSASVADIHADDHHGTVGPLAVLSTDIPPVAPAYGGTRSIDSSDPNASFGELSGINTNDISLLTNELIERYDGFTMECWFKWNGGGSVNALVDYAGTEKLSIISGELRMQFNEFDQFVIGTPTPGQWHYVAAVFDTNGASIGGFGEITGDLLTYFDGYAPTTTPITVTKGTWGDSLNRPISIGQHPVGFPADFFDGSVYEPRVTLGALAAADLMITSLLGAPVGDECFDPIVMFGNSATVDTTIMTSSSEPTSDAACPGTLLGDYYHDAWYEWTASTTGKAAFGVCGATFDSDIGVYQGECGSLISLGCNGDGCLQSDGSTPFASRTVIDIVVGETYLVRVGGFSTAQDDDGTGTLRIHPWSEGTEFIRGDCNGDSSVDIGDVIFAANGLFLVGSTPATCLDACDVNDDGAFDIADPINLANYLFLGSAPPVAPFPECGADPTFQGGVLECESYEGCALPLVPGNHIRINCGGEELAALDGGVPWQADTLASPSTYEVTANGVVFLDPLSPANQDATVPLETPTELFRSERYYPADLGGGRWEFPMGVGEFEVRLYFIENYHIFPMDRIFDVHVGVANGGPVPILLNDFDLIADIGYELGTMASTTLEISDPADIIVIQFFSEIQNPNIGGIEILPVAGKK